MIMVINALSGINGDKEPSAMDEMQELHMPVDQIALKLIQIRYQRLNADDPMRLPLSDVFRLLLVTSGEGKCTIDGRIVPVERGSCCLLPPGSYSAASLSSGEGMVWYDISFAATPYDPKLAYGKNALCSYSVIPEGNLVQAVELAKRLYTDRETSDRMEQFRLNVTFQELVYWVMKEAGTRSAGNAKEAIAVVTDYMERHFRDKLTRDMLAEKAGMSPEYFSRMFKKETGMTVVECLTCIRMNHAKRELIRQRASISAVAEYVGFEEQYYFTRKFKQTVGFTPTAYMRKQKNRVVCLFGPYVDHLLALDVMPLAIMMDKAHPLASSVRTCMHLGGEEVDWKERNKNQLLRLEPDLIIASSYIDPRLEIELNHIAPAITVAFKQEWRQALREIAAVLDKSAEAEEAVRRYEAKSAEAARRLQEAIGVHSVALLRVHADQLRLYGGSSLSYTAPVMYEDLKLSMPRLVRRLALNHSCVSIDISMLAQLDADRLLLVIDPGCEHKARLLVDGNIWKELPAVRNGYVYEADYYTWMSGGIMMNSRKIEDAVRLLAAD
jgi:AraC-like DNA-binding protein